MRKIGRNERCPCGSGKKYKRCCLDSDVPGRAPPPRRSGFADAMVAFAQPLLEGGDGSPQETQKALDLAMLFWNLAVMPAGEREEFYETYLSRTTGVDPQEFRTIADQMIERHRLLFPEHHV